jgi:hypothetical protein
MMIVNTIQIEHLKKTATNENNNSFASITPDIESMLVRGENGDKLPKTTYWLSIKKVAPTSVASTAPEK